jgi:hypothetical protein
MSALINTKKSVLKQFRAAARTPDDGSVIKYTYWAESVWTVSVITDLDERLASPSLRLGGCK